MPKATAEARQQNAHERALATVAGLPKVDMSAYKVPDPPDQTCRTCGKTGYSLDEFLSPSTGQCFQCSESGVDVKIEAPKKEENALPETAEAEVIETKPEPKPRQRKPQVQAQEEASVSQKRQPSEDFFDYLQRITPEEWSNTQTSGLYIYKKSARGNVRITDEPIHGPITLAEFREQFYPTHGDGNYRLQFTTSLKHLTSCGENVTLDGSGASLGSGPMASLGGGSVAPGVAGFTDAIKATSEMLKDGAKAAVDVSRAQQMEQVKGFDVGAMLTGMAAIMANMAPKKDDEGQKLLFTMLAGQRKDAERRAEQAEKDADRREQRAKEEADRREREADRRAQDAKAEADRQRERDKEFFGILLKQSESKADSLNQMTGLLTSFMKVKETIDDTMGGGPKGPWDLVGNVADSIIQNGPAIVAAVKGASPQQVQQMQERANPQPQPFEIPPFYEMIIRLDRYFARDPQLYDGEYIVQMIQEEFDGVANDIFKMPKETVLNSIAAFDPPGKNIIDRKESAEFMAKVIDVIKFPDTMDDIFGGSEDDDEGPEAENPPMVRRGRPRKLNAVEKVERVS